MLIWRKTVAVGSSSEGAVCTHPPPRGCASTTRSPTGFLEPEHRLGSWHSPASAGLPLVASCPRDSPHHVHSPLRQPQGVPDLRECQGTDAASSASVPQPRWFLQLCLELLRSIPGGDTTCPAPDLCEVTGWDRSCHRPGSAQQRQELAHRQRTPSPVPPDQASSQDQANQGCQGMVQSSLCGEQHLAGSPGCAQGQSVCSTKPHARVPRNPEHRQVSVRCLKRCSCPGGRATLCSAPHCSACSHTFPEQLRHGTARPARAQSPGTRARANFQQAAADPRPSPHCQRTSWSLSRHDVGTERQTRGGKLRSVADRARGAVGQRDAHTAGPMAPPADSQGPDSRAPSTSRMPQASPRLRD